jgi:hypothetical protein
MADVFGVDTAAVAATASELSQIRASLGGLGDFAGHGDVTGSARVRGALENFVTQSSDARRKLDSELERAAGLLSGLAEGATTLDSSLAESVTMDGPATMAGATTRGALS